MRRDTFRVNRRYEAMIRSRYNIARSLWNALRAHFQSWKFAITPWPRTVHNGIEWNTNECRATKYDLFPPISILLLFTIKTEQIGKNIYRQCYYAQITSNISYYVSIIIIYNFIIINNKNLNKDSIIISINFYSLILTKFMVYIQYFVTSVFLWYNEFSNRILFSRRPSHSISLEYNNGSCCDYVSQHENVPSIISSHLILLSFTHHLCAVAAS